MKLSGSLAALLLAAGPLAAQATPEFEPAVAALVADAWHLDPAQVRIQWAGSVPAGSAATGLRLEGTGQDGWFVAVLGSGSESSAVRFRAGHPAVRAVAARPMASGHILDAADFREDTLTVWGPPGEDQENIEAGWVLRRPVPAGLPLDGLAAPPLVIKAGDPVRVVWEREGLRLSMEGTASNQARYGEAVRVRVEGRSGRVTGLAEGPGTVVLEELP